MIARARVSRVRAITTPASVPRMSFRLRYERRLVDRARARTCARLGFGRTPTILSILLICPEIGRVKNEGDRGLFKMLIGFCRQIDKIDRMKTIPQLMAETDSTECGTAMVAARTNRTATQP